MDGWMGMVVRKGGREVRKGGRKGKEGMLLCSLFG